MNRQEFIDKYHQECGFTTSDVLMSITSNLSDLHIEKGFFTPEQMDAKLNTIKEYISDYRSLIKHEEMTQRQREDESREFYDHLGRYY
jgi:hypothetical protein